MKSTNLFKAGALIVGAMLIGTFAFVTANENSNSELSIQSQNSTELLATNNLDFDGKCGEGKCGEGKESEKKEEAKKSENKKEENKKEAKKSKKSKENKEAKCGEGKCGGE